MNIGKRLANEKNTKKPFYAYVKGKTKSRQTVGPLKRGDEKRTENDKGTAEELNKFFASVYSKKNAIPLPPLPERREPAEQQMRRGRVTEKRIRRKERR